MEELARFGFPGKAILGLPQTNPSPSFGFPGKAILGLPQTNPSRRVGFPGKPILGLPQTNPSPRFGFPGKPILGLPQTNPSRRVGFPGKPILGLPQTNPSRRVGFPGKPILGLPQTNPSRWFGFPGKPRWFFGRFGIGGGSAVSRGNAIDRRRLARRVGRGSSHPEQDAFPGKPIVDLGKTNPILRRTRLGNPDVEPGKTNPIARLLEDAHPRPAAKAAPQDPRKNESKPRRLASRQRGHAERPPILDPGPRHVVAKGEEIRGVERGHRQSVGHEVFLAESEPARGHRPRSERRAPFNKIVARGRQ
jgi:hypothetical protein